MIWNFTCSRQPFIVLVSYSLFYLNHIFTISEILAYEDLGFAKPGEGARLIDEKQTYLGGKIPVNLDGGLLSKGHPIGATGGAQIRTIVRQLRGEASEAQVEGAEIGLVHNIGGIGHYANVTILRR